MVHAGMERGVKIPRGTIADLITQACAAFGLQDQSHLGLFTANGVELDRDAPTSLLAAGSLVVLRPEVLHA